MLHRKYSLLSGRSLTLGFALLLSAVGTTAVHAQDGLKTQFFMAPEARISKVAGGTAVVSGFNTGWIINNSLILGGTSFGTNYGIEPNVAYLGSNLEATNAKAEFKYRGGIIGWQFKNSPSLKTSITTVIGRGSLRSMGTDKPVLADRIWVFEPMANLNVRVASWGSLSAGAGYRLTTGGEYNGIDKNDLRSPTARIGITIGGW